MLLRRFRGQGHYLYGSDCFGNDFGPSADGTVSMWSENSSVATVGTYGGVSYVGAGTTNIDGQKYIIEDYYNDGYSCIADREWYQATGGDGAQVTVLVPTDSRIVSTIASYAINSTTNPACPSGQAGWYRQVYKKVTDQYGDDINVDGQSLTENVTVGRNDLQIGSVGTSSGTTGGGGLFTDTLKVCSSLCPGSSGETDATQVIQDVWPYPPNDTYTLKTNNFKYTCTGNTINGQ